MASRRMKFIANNHREHRSGKGRNNEYHSSKLQQKLKRCKLLKIQEAELKEMESEGL
jgi:hypothetical protein